MTNDTSTSTYAGTLLHEQPLSRYNSWNIGGVAKQFYKPKDLSDCGHFLASLPISERVIFLGLGSNILFPDGTLNATVISTRGALNGLSVVSESNLIRAEAGVTCAKLARFAAKHGYESAAFFAGIPGTVGGALAMNAGAFGGETWPHVLEVECMDRSGKIHRYDASQFKVGYRQVQGPDGFFVAAHFRFSPGKPQAAEAAIKTLLKQRNNAQPIGTWNCGSVFRNPPGDYAARLIEASGLKGHQLGGAQISPVHANFIVNVGDATAADVLALMQLIQNAVMMQFQVALVPEVQIIDAEE